MNVLAIDTGNIESAYCLIEKETYKCLKFGKIDNEELLHMLKYDDFDADVCSIEMIASYGMAVGKEVFETCLWIGRFYERCNFDKVDYIYRKDVKMNICGNTRAKDSNIIQALKDRFGDKGTKKEPGWFYGFSKDVWQAYSVGVTQIDKLRGE